MRKEQTAEVAVIMAVYNGEKYLEEQIRSIAAQAYPNWHLFLSDDHSSDSSPEIMARMAGLYPDRLTLAENDSGRKGSRDNFAYAMIMARGYGYYMFSDQDDVWMPDKIAVLMERMNGLEQLYGKDFPLLVYSDLEVTDTALHTVSGSFLGSSGLKLPEKNILQQFLLYNCIPGCSMMMNGALYNLAGDIPGEAYMHDWWIALTAAAFGRIELEARPLMKYRQHSANTVGTIRAESDAERLKKYASLGKIGKAYANNRDMKALRREQAAKFLMVFEDRLPAEEAALIRKFLRLLDRRGPVPAFLALKSGFRFLSPAYTVKFFGM